MENEFEALILYIVEHNKCFSYEYYFDFMTIEEIVMSEKRYRNKRKRKYKLLVVFSFLSCKGEKMKNGKLLVHVKGESRGRCLGRAGCRGPLRKSGPSFSLSMICVSFNCIGVSLKLDMGIIWL